MTFSRVSRLTRLAAAVLLGLSVAGCLEGSLSTGSISGAASRPAIDKSPVLLVATTRRAADDPESPVEGEFEVGWRLREDAWGKGYAKEAAIASLDFAFDRLGAERVVALTVEGNAPSWGLMLRLGMVRRADLDYDTASWAEGPVIVYEMRREQWRS